MGMYDDCPCRYCVPPKRHLGCHGHCKEKDDWDETLNGWKDAIQTEQEKASQAVGFLVDSQRRVAKRLKLKTGGRQR